MPAATAPSIVRFGSFRVDLATEQLWNGSDPLPLRPKTWQVLRYLVEHAGRLVTKDELLDTVWGDVSVEEKAVNTCIGEIRTALGDSSRRPRFVETVQRRGFRFLAAPAADAPAPSDATGSRSAFVGRAEELETLVARISGAGDDVVLTVVSGAAGIGKTRLVREAALRAGVTALVGQCIEDGGLPYLPWVEMIHQQLRSGAQPGWSEAGAATSELERLVPGLQPAGAAAAPGSSDPELARIRLFEALASFFAAASRERPLVLVLEDLQWIDAASLRALQALVPRLAGGRMHVVATLRDEDAAAGSPVRTAIEALRRRGLVASLPLEGLAPAETRALVAEIAGTELPAAVVAKIAVGSEGSPFFIEEILRHYEGGGDFTLPDNVLEIFERRLRRLSPSARRLVDVVAVCGRDADEPLLEHALDMSDLELAGVVGEAIDQKILREAEGRAGRYGFEHALMALSIRQRLAPPRTRILHARLAEAVAATVADPAERAAETARYLVRAVPSVPPMRAIDALVEASEHAASGLAYEDAVEHCAQALALARGAAVGSEIYRRLPELAVRYAEALQRIGDAQAAGTAFREAAGLSREARQLEWLARAALGMATIWDFEAPDVREQLEDALARLEGEQPTLRARLLARLAVVLYPLPGTRRRCEALSTEAVELARRTGNSTLLAHTLVDWLAAQWYPDNLAAQDRASEELVAAARRSDDGALLATAHGWRVVIALCQGDFKRAESDACELRSLAARLGQPLYSWCALYLGATLAVARADLAEAESLANEAFELGRVASPQSATVVYFTQMISIRREQDRINELLPLIEQSPTRLSGDALLWNLPHFYLEAGRIEDGRKAFEEACALGFDAMPGENSRNRRLLTLGAMAHACAALGDRRIAAPLYDIVRRESGRWAVAGFGAVSFGLLDNGAGALASCLGDYDAAERHFDYVLSEYAKRDVPVSLARTLCLYAETLLRRRRDGDEERAQELLGRARAIADRYGLQRIRALAEQAARGS